MIVAFGSGPPKLLEALRTYLDHPNTFIYPEFFDAKKYLINKEWSRYAQELMRNVAMGITIIAVFPDYCYDKCLAILKPIMDRVIWVYPMHYRRELEWILNRFDREAAEYYLGFPNRPELRDFDMDWFLDIAKKYGFRTWLMGLKPRFAKYVRYIDACDVTTLSIPSWAYRDNVKEYKGIPPEMFVAHFMKVLAEKRIVLHGRMLKNVFFVKPLVDR